MIPYILHNHLSQMRDSTHGLTKLCVNLHLLDALTNFESELSLGYP